MYKLKSGRNKFDEWQLSEASNSNDKPLKTSTFRVQPEFEEEIMEFVERFDTPFNSRSELVRISCRIMIDAIQNNEEDFTNNSKLRVEQNQVI